MFVPTKLIKPTATANFHLAKKMQKVLCYTLEPDILQKPYISTQKKENSTWYVTHRLAQCSVQKNTKYYFQYQK